MLLDSVFKMGEDKGISWVLRIEIWGNWDGVAGMAEEKDILYVSIGGNKNGEMGAGKKVKEDFERIAHVQVGGKRNYIVVEVVNQASIGK